MAILFGQLHVMSYLLMCKCWQELSTEHHNNNTERPWWGYLHENGKVKTKLWQRPAYGVDCDACYAKRDGGFAVYVIKPFWAISSDYAREHACTAVDKYIVSTLKREISQTRISEDPSLDRFKSLG